MIVRDQKLRVRGEIDMAARTGGRANDRYYELVQKCPLKHLRTDRELDDAIEMIDSLLAKEELALASKTIWMC